MERFPQMLYRFPATGLDIVALQDGSYGTKIVDDDAELEAAVAEGWHETSPAARAAGEALLASQAEAAAAAIADAATQAQAEAAAAAAAPPTRAELEAKATELQISFDGRTSNKKLRDLIAATLEA